MTYGYRFVQGTVRTMNVVVSAQLYRMKNQATHAMPRPEVTLEIAIAAQTRGSAYVNFLETDTGTIEEGKLADLVVLDRDIFDPGAGWQCVCAEFKTTDDCRHVRESQGRHAAQAVIAKRIGSPLEQSGHGLERT